MDALTKRQFWKAVSKVRRAGSSIMLTTHSMEECEAICTRLGIMVNGEFSCLGSPQHLKNSFPKGYILIVRIKPKKQKTSRLYAVEQESPTKETELYILSKFAGSTLK